MSATTAAGQGARFGARGEGLASQAVRAVSQEASAASLEPMIQMNTRIDRRLKQSGDEALRHAGFTPSQAVRHLWEFASRHRHDPAAIRSVLAGGAASGISGARSHEQAVDEAEDVLRGPRIIDDARRRLGVSPAAAASVSDGDLREWALSERMAQRGVR